METTNNHYDKIINQLNWLRLRYKNLYKDNQAAELTKNIIDFFQNKQKINQNIIEKICSKLYYGFYVDKDKGSMFDIGYTEQERQNIKKHILNIIDLYNQECR